VGSHLIGNATCGRGGRGLVVQGKVAGCNAPRALNNMPITK